MPVLMRFPSTANGRSGGGQESIVFVLLMALCAGRWEGTPTASSLISLLPAMFFLPITES